MANKQGGPGQQIKLQEYGDWKLVLDVRARQCALVVLDAASSPFRRIDCRLSTLCDAGDGMTVHLAGGGALCSISASQGVVQFEISGAREEPELRFSIPQAEFQATLTRAASQAHIES